MMVAKGAYVTAAVQFVTVPILLARFSADCYKEFQLGIKSMPLDLAHDAPPAHVEPWVYTPASLHNRAWSWCPDWAKTWEGWGMKY